MSIECIFRGVRWLVFVFFFFHASARETWADVTGYRRSREGKVAHGLLVHVTASRVLGHTRVTRLPDSPVATDMCNICVNTREYRLHDTVRNELSPSPLSWRPLESPKSCGLREGTRSRRRSCKKKAGEWTGKFNKRLTPVEILTAKKKWGKKRAISLLHADTSRMFSCTPNTHLQFMALMFSEVRSEVLPWEIVYCCTYMLTDNIRS